MPLFVLVPSLQDRITALAKLGDENVLPEADFFRLRKGEKVNRTALLGVLGELEISLEDAMGVMLPYVICHATSKHDYGSNPRDNIFTDESMTSHKRCDVCGTGLVHRMAHSGETLSSDYDWPFGYNFGGTARRMRPADWKVILVRRQLLTEIEEREAMLSPRQNRQSNRTA